VPKNFSWEPDKSQIPRGRMRPTVPLGCRT